VLSKIKGYVPAGFL